MTREATKLLRAGPIAVWRASPLLLGPVRVHRQRMAANPRTAKIPYLGSAQIRK